MNTRVTELIFLLADQPPLGAEVVARLKTEGIAVDLTEDEGLWHITSLDEPSQWSLYPRRATDVEPSGLEREILEAEDFEAMVRAGWAIHIQATLPKGDIPQQFQRLLHIAMLVAPTCVGLFDTDAGAFHPRSWLIESTRQGVPMNMDALYRMHAEGEGQTIWLHTHGLRRCGLQEIEILEVSEDILQLAGRLLEAVSNRAILYGLPDMGESVSYGRNIDCALVPWTYAHDENLQITGGAGDRDEDHPPESLVLCSWERTSETTGRWRSAADSLYQDPPPDFFITEYETERSESIARLRWQTFASLVSTYGESEGWRFLAKFSYGGGGPSPREHLWFHVHGADPISADATLINQPNQRLGLEEGQRGRHMIDRLTDFRIGSPVGTATPDSIDRLIHSLLKTMNSEAH